MRVLYIGYYNEGSTARMRGEYLKELLPGSVFDVVNIDVPLHQTGRLARSLGWRFKKGPLIKNINNYIVGNVSASANYDITWIDKGVFVRPEVVAGLKKKSGMTVHYTPDPAFRYHRSQLFYESLPFYDHCITTKSFEIADYEKYGVHTILCTQGFDPQLHKSYHSFEEKRGVVFIGHHEDEREAILSAIVESGIPLTLAGIKWKKFAGRYRNKTNLVYKGNGVYGSEYAKTISAAVIGLGLLSRWIPERHTTRTFEIPACGTALLTERNEETGSFFNDNEVLFFGDPRDITDMIKDHIARPEMLRSVSENGYRKVRSDGYDYKNILKRALQQLTILS